MKCFLKFLVIPILVISVTPVRLYFPWTWTGDPIKTNVLGFKIYVNDTLIKTVDAKTFHAELMITDQGLNKIEVTAYGALWETERSKAKYIKIP